VKSCIGNMVRTAAVLAGGTLSARAVTSPAAPTVIAMPAKGESFELFQQHESDCRQYAGEQSSGASSQQAVARTGITSAAIGTGIGATAGALMGSASGHAGNGAAIGAGTGLLVGTMIGSAHARGASALLQRQYDIAYTQCMAAKGESIEPPASRSSMFPRHRRRRFAGLPRLVAARLRAQPA